jgi:hypothetical protein
MEQLGNVLGLEKDAFLVNTGKRNPSVVMTNAICLFTGYELSLTELETYNFRTAVAENGVCVYMECLESMTPRPELLRRIHVIPGHIGRGTRMFDSIWDCAPTQVPSLQRVVIQRAVEEQQIAVEPYLPNSLTMTALVDEPSGPGQLSLYYRISTPQEQVLLQPGAVSSCVLQRSGLVLCSKSNCGSGFEANTYFVQSGWRFDTRTLDELPNYNYNWTLGKGAFIWKHISLNVARLLAIALLRQSHFDFRAISHIFLRQDECLPCSVRSALQMVQDLGHAHPTNQQLIHIL